MYERLGLGITLDFEDKASAKVKNIVGQFENLINVSGRLVKGFDSGIASLHFEGLTVAGFALERLAGRMDYYGKKIVKGFGAMGKAVIDAGAEMETYRNIFEVFYKSQEEASKRLAWAMDYAAKTPFKMTDVIDSVKAMKAIGVEVDKTFTSETTGKVRTFMDALGDLAILAPPTQGIQGMMLAIRNLYGGNERSFTMRMDIRPSQILGHSVGKTPDEITQSLIELSEKLAPQMMEKLFGTWTQIITNFDDQYQRLLFSLNNAGAFNTAKKSLMDLYMVVNDIRGEELQEIATNLSDVFTFLWKPVDLFSKALQNAINMFTKLSKEYPFVMKIVSGVTLASGAFLIGAGAILKWCGMIIMAIAALATFYVNVIIFRLQTELMNTALLRGIKTIGLFAKSFIISALVVGGAIYAYEKNLCGFKDTVDDVLFNITNSWRNAWNLLFKENDPKRLGLQHLEGLEKFFAKVISFGRLIKILFTQQLGDTIFFTLRQMEDFKGLGMWNFARLMVQAKGRFDAFVSGFKDGIKIISDMLKNFLETVFAPIFAMFGGIDNIISKLVGKDSLFGIIPGRKDDIENYIALGDTAGKLLGVLLGFKAVKSLGAFITSPFVLLSKTLTEVGEKIKWSGGLFKKAFGRNKPFFYDTGAQRAQKKRSNEIVDLINADSDNPVKLAYSRNPFKRLAEKRKLYKATTNLKRMELAQLVDTPQTIKDLFTPDQVKDHTDYLKKASKGQKKTLGKFTSQPVYDDATQGFLSKVFLGQKKQVYSKENIKINGQEVTVPKVDEFRKGGLLSGFYSKFGGAGYNNMFDKDEQGKLRFNDLDSFGKPQKEIRDKVRKNFTDTLKKPVKQLTKSNFLNVIDGVCRGTIDAVRWANADPSLRKGSLAKRKTAIARLQKTIATMESRGNKKQLPSMYAQLANLTAIPVSTFSSRDTIAKVRGLPGKAYTGIKETKTGKFIGKGFGKVGGGLGKASDWFEGMTGIDMKQLPKEMKKNMPKGIFGKVKGAGKGLVGGAGMLARGAGALGGGLLAAAPWLLAAGAVGGGIYSKLAGGQKGDDGLQTAKGNLKALTEDMDKNGALKARQFWSKFTTEAKEIFPLIKDFAVATFKGIASSGVFSRMWEGLKMGAKLVWAWIKTEGITHLARLFTWILTTGIGLLLKGLWGLVKWIATDLVPALLKTLAVLGATLLKVLKTAVVEGLTLGINLVKGLVPNWIKKLFGGESVTIEKSEGVKEVQYGLGFPEVHHKGLWKSPNEHLSIIRKDETVLPPDISRKLNDNLTGEKSGGGDIRIDKVDVIVQAEKLSAQDARKQALLILKELEKLKGEDMLRKGSSKLAFV